MAENTAPEHVPATADGTAPSPTREHVPATTDGTNPSPTPATADGRLLHALPRAFFSTEGGTKPARRLPNPPPPVIVRSDPARDERKMIANYRERWPQVCESIFAKSEVSDTWHISWFFDEYDFHVQGGEFLYNLVMTIMNQNQENAMRMAHAWFENNDPGYHPLLNLEHVAFSQIFNERDCERYAPAFLNQVYQIILATLASIRNAYSAPAYMQSHVAHNGIHPRFIPHMYNGPPMPPVPEHGPAIENTGAVAVPHGHAFPAPGATAHPMQQGAIPPGPPMPPIYGVPNATPSGVQHPPTSGVPCPFPPVFYNGQWVYPPPPAGMQQVQPGPSVQFPAPAVPPYLEPQTFGPHAATNFQQAQNAGAYPTSAHRNGPDPRSYRNHNSTSNSTHRPEYQNSDGDQSRKTSFSAGKGRRNSAPRGRGGFKFSGRKSSTEQTGEHASRTQQHASSSEHTEPELRIASAIGLRLSPEQDENDPSKPGAIESPSKPQTSAGISENKQLRASEDLLKETGDSSRQPTKSEGNDSLHSSRRNSVKVNLPMQRPAQVDNRNLIKVPRGDILAAQGVTVKPEMAIGKEHIGKDVEDVFQLYVQLNGRITRENIIEALANITSVEDVSVRQRILHDNKNTFAFVQFYSTSDVRKVLQHSPITCKGYELRFQTAIQDRTCEYYPKRGGYYDNSTRLPSSDPPQGIVRQGEDPQGSSKKSAKNEAVEQATLANASAKATYTPQDARSSLPEAKPNSPITPAAPRWADIVAKAATATSSSKERLPPSEKIPDALNLPSNPPLASKAIVEETSGKSSENIPERVQDNIPSNDKGKARAVPLANEQGKLQSLSQTRNKPQDQQQQEKQPHEKQQEGQQEKQPVKLQNKSQDKTQAKPQDKTLPKSQGRPSGKPQGKLQGDQQDETQDRKQASVPEKAAGEADSPEKSQQNVSILSNEGDSAAISATRLEETEGGPAETTTSPTPISTESDVQLTPSQETPAVQEQESEPALREELVPEKDIEAESLAEKTGDENTDHPPVPEATSEVHKLTAQSEAVPATPQAPNELSPSQVSDDVSDKGVGDDRSLQSEQVSTATHQENSLVSAVLPSGVEEEDSVEQTESSKSPIPESHAVSTSFNESAHESTIDAATSTPEDSASTTPIGHTAFEAGKVSEPKDETGLPAGSVVANKEQSESPAQKKKKNKTKKRKGKKGSKEQNTLTAGDATKSTEQSGETDGQVDPPNVATNESVETAFDADALQSENASPLSDEASEEHDQSFHSTTSGQDETAAAGSDTILPSTETVQINTAESHVSEKKAKKSPSPPPDPSILDSQACAALKSDLGDWTTEYNRIMETVQKISDPDKTQWINEATTYKAQLEEHLVRIVSKDSKSKARDVSNTLKGRWPKQRRLIVEKYKECLENMMFLEGKVARQAECNDEQEREKSRKAYPKVDQHSSTPEIPHGSWSVKPAKSTDQFGSAVKSYYSDKRLYNHVIEPRNPLDVGTPGIERVLDEHNTSPTTAGPTTNDGANTDESNETSNDEATSDSSSSCGSRLSGEWVQGGKKLLIWEADESEVGNLREILLQPPSTNLSKSKSLSSLIHFLLAGSTSHRSNEQIENDKPTSDVQHTPAADPLVGPSSSPSMTSKALAPSDSASGPSMDPTPLTKESSKVTKPVTNPPMSYAEVVASNAGSQTSGDKGKGRALESSDKQGASSLVAPLSRRQSNTTSSSGATSKGRSGLGISGFDPTGAGPYSNEGKVEDKDWKVGPEGAWGRRGIHSRKGGS